MDLAQMYGVDRILHNSIFCLCSFSKNWDMPKVYQKFQNNEFEAFSKFCIAFLSINAGSLVRMAYIPWMSINNRNKLHHSMEIQVVKTMATNLQYQMDASINS